MSMVIAIDGPAGAGKSTVTRAIAERLGILYLDTGAMYRAATVAIDDAGIDRDHADAIADLVAGLRIAFDEQGRVTVDDAIIPDDRLRSPQTTAEIWRVADHPRCREHLVAQQQAIIASRDAAIEGRDATTVICPDADLKIYLDASAEERARRRLSDWRQRGIETDQDLAAIAADIRQRDERDANRSVGALRIAEDAIVIDTDGIDSEQVIARIMAYAVQRRPLLLEQVVADQIRVGRSRQAGYVKVARGIHEGPQATWQLGLTNPAPDRLPHTTTTLTRNHGGRQAGVVCQGRPVLALAGRGERPGPLVVLPMLPQTWYVIEPGTWHACIQPRGTICAWAEASVIEEERHPLDEASLAILRTWLDVYLPSGEG